ncbi:hypothetical protein FOT68_21790 [Citrobacter braakii]|nr:hypothetical protein [Citrobacter braakii]
MAIFPPGAGIVKGTAIVPLTRSQRGLFQRSDKHKVNVAIYRRQQIHYLRMCHSSSLTDKHDSGNGAFFYGARGKHETNRTDMCSAAVERPGAGG